jgi:hypothetical protein
MGFFRLARRMNRLGWIHLDVHGFVFSFNPCVLPHSHPEGEEENASARSPTLLHSRLGIDYVLGRQFTQSRLTMSYHPSRRLYHASHSCIAPAHESSLRSGL